MGFAAMRANKHRPEDLTNVILVISIASGRLIVVDSNERLNGGDVAREVDAGSRFGRSLTRSFALLPAPGPQTPGLWARRAAENHAKQIRNPGLNSTHGGDCRISLCATRGFPPTGH
jgi:hypothetical protein